jgi:hypothetical protein
MVGALIHAEPDSVKRPTKNAFDSEAAFYYARLPLACHSERLTLVLFASHLR